VARLLLIDPDRRALVTLQKALREAGFTSVTAVPSGSFALTMVERERPHLIVSRVRIPDIGGLELCAIIRSDPALAGVRLLLLAEEAEDVSEETTRTQVDHIMVGEFDPDQLVQAVQRLLAEAPAAKTGAAPVTVGTKSAQRALRGSLGVMDLAEVTQAIALGLKSGQLMLTLAAGPGVIVFDRGRVIDAQFGRLRGEPAFAALLNASHRESDGSFCFNPQSGEHQGQAVERTIDRSVESLLLATAAEIDEGRTGTTDVVSRW
jgi:CheY-like chemotaxis protein